MYVFNNVITYRVESFNVRTYVHTYIETFNPISYWCSSFTYCIPTYYYYVQEYAYSSLQSSDDTPPTPTRGPNVKSSEGEEEESEDEDSGPSAKAGPPQSMADLMPKVDIR